MLESKTRQFCQFNRIGQYREILKIQNQNPTKKRHVTLQITAIRIHQSMIFTLEFLIVILQRYPQVSHKDSIWSFPQNSPSLGSSLKAVFNYSFSKAKFLIPRSNPPPSSFTLTSYILKAIFTPIFYISISLFVDSPLGSPQKSTTQTPQKR